jgi:hypothetical protein
MCFIWEVAGSNLGPNISPHTEAVQHKDVLHGGMQHEVDMCYHTKQ